MSIEDNIEAHEDAISYLKWIAYITSGTTKDKALQSAEKLETKLKKLRK